MLCASSFMRLHRVCGPRHTGLATPLPAPRTADNPRRSLNRRFSFNFNVRGAFPPLANMCPRTHSSEAVDSPPLPPLPTSNTATPTPNPPAPRARPHRRSSPRIPDRPAFSPHPLLPAETSPWCASLLLARAVEQEARELHLAAQRLGRLRQQVRDLCTHTHTRTHSYVRTYVRAHIRAHTERQAVVYKCACR